METARGGTEVLAWFLPPTIDTFHNPGLFF
jgi:hypothetical protein